MGFHQQIQYQSTTEPVFTGGETITEDKWHQPWSLPVRQKIDPRRAVALAASGEFFTSPTVGETISVDKWFAQLSKPVVLSKLGLRTGDQQSIAFQPAPSPFAPTGWYDWLSEPVRIKPGLRASAQQFSAYDPASPIVLTPFSWFADLSDPVRQKRGLGSWLQQFFTIDTAVLPVTKLAEWFAWLSEPVRIKLGLKAANQQFLASPPRILPTPNITAVLNASELGDVFIGSIRDYNAALFADVSIQEKGQTFSPVAIVENTQQLANVGVQASLPSTQSGSPIAGVKANVSIRET
jgi:hypothetical protein